MSKAHYAFWRKPWGAPDFSSGPNSSGPKVDQFAPSETIKRYFSSIEVTSTGIKHSNFSEAYALDFIFEAGLAIVDENRHEIGREDAKQIIQGAISDVCASGCDLSNVLPRQLLKAVNDRAANFMKQPKRKFIVTATISTTGLPAQTIRSCDCELRLAVPAREAPKITIQDHSANRALSKHIASSKYDRVEINVEARSECEAVSRASIGLAIVRALWTLSQVGKYTISFGFQTPKPLGLIVDGPVHFLYDEQGNPNEDVYWYDPGYRSDIRLFDMGKYWKSAESFRLEAEAKLEDNPLAPRLRRLLVDYVEALDHGDHNVAWLNMWAILEKLTDSDSYDIVIKRATWLFENPKLVAEQLEAIRTDRNRLVHAGATREDRNVSMNLLRKVVDPLLRFAIRNDPGFKSLEHMASVLSLPRDQDAIERRISDLQYALSVHAPTCEPKQEGTQ